MNKKPLKMTMPLRASNTKLAGGELDTAAAKLSPGWRVVHGQRLFKEYTFGDFTGATEFVSRVGKLAEEVDHHPEMMVSWGRVELRVWTQAIDGLTEVDFAFAARADGIYRGSIPP